MMFISTNAKDRRKIFENHAYALEAIHSLYRVQNLHPFHLFGFVIMPDHCHLLLFVREPEQISKILQSFKYGLTFNLGIGAFWQPRFHLSIPKNSYKVLEYIHQNPVKAGLVTEAERYPWSSASGRWPVSLLQDF